MKDYDYFFNSYISFYKVSTDNKILKGGKFELYSADNTASGKTFEQKSDGRYHMNIMSKEDGKDTFVYNLLPKVLQDKFDSVKTLEDIDSFDEYGDYFHVSPWVSGGKYNSPGVNVWFYLPIKLKQIRGDNGFTQNDIVVNAHVTVTYYYNEGENTFTHKEVYLSNFNLEDGFIYGKDIGKITSINDLAHVNYTNFSDDTLGGSSCIESNAGKIVTTNCNETEWWGSVEYEMIPYFVDGKGTVKFEIENTVNGLGKYNASKSKALKYDITVKNVGNASSGDNVIVTYVPEKVTVDEEKISDNGVYNKDNHTITWNFDYIEIGEVLGVSYEGYAPEKTNGEELIGKSSVGSAQLGEVVYSSNTVVTMDKVVEVIKNPETGTMVYIANTNIGISLTHLILFLSILLLVVLFLVKKLFKVKKYN